MAEQQKGQCKGGVCDTPPEAFDQYRFPTQVDVEEYIAQKRAEEAETINANVEQVKARSVNAAGEQQTEE